MVYLFSLAAYATPALAFVPAGITWREIIPILVRSTAESFGSWYVTLTLCGASRLDRPGQTLRMGLRYALLVHAWFLVIGPLPFLICWWVYGTMVVDLPALLTGALWFYSLVAASVSAGRLADRKYLVADLSDPLWPWCIACRYSLRGLPATEAWLAGRQGAAPRPPTTGGSSACPECGRAITDSLEEHARRLERLRGLEFERPTIRTTGDFLRCLLTGRLSEPLRWLLHASRTRAATIWLVSTLMLALPLLLPMRRSFGLLYLLWDITDHWQSCFLWVGMAILLPGLWTSWRMQRGAIWQAHALAGPPIWLVALLAPVAALLWPDALAHLRRVPYSISVFLPLSVPVLLLNVVLLSVAQRLGHRADAPVNS